MKMSRFLPEFIFAFCIPLLSFSQGKTEYFPSTLKYKLDLRIDHKNEKLTGSCELTISNKTDSTMEKIPLLLYRQLSVKSAVNEEGGPLRFTQDIICIKGWEKIQVNFIEIFLEEKLLPGAQRTISINYDGFLSGYSADGWRYVKDHIARDFTMIRTDGFGYPVVGYPSDPEMMAITRERYEYAIDVTVQKDLRVVSGGELIQVKETDEETTYSFRSKKPSWRLDIAIADYLAIERNRNKVFCFRTDTAAAKAMLDALEKTVETYSEWFGDIKDYKGYTIVEVPEGYGSQADVSSFCLTADNFKNPKDNSGLYHELSHLWDIIPFENEPCRLESEGRAQFLQFLLSEKFDNKGDAISNAIQRYLNDIQKNFRKNAGYQAIPVRDYGISNMTEYSYTLGMIFFAMFYDLAGKENFNKAIRSYVSGDYKNGASLDDFVGCCKKYAFFNAEKFFNDWIYSVNAIKLIVDGASYEELKALYR